MNARLAGWWKSRAPREQKLLLAGGLLALAVLLWLLIVRPLEDALSAAKERHDDAVVTLSEVKTNIEALGLVQGQTGGAGGAIDTVAAAAATEAGFPVARVERPGPGEATLVIEAVKPQAFFAWLGRMEAERGLIVARLSVSANADRTLAAQVTFRSRAA